MAVSPDGRNLYVACGEACQLLWVSLPSGELARYVDLPDRPTDLLVSADGNRLIVACAAESSSVLVIDASSAKTLRTIAAGHTAMGLAIAPSGEKLYVCNRFDNHVSVVDLQTGTELARVPTVREPIAVAAAPDGRSVLVINHLPNTRSDEDFPGPVSPVVTVLDTATQKTRRIELPFGSHSLRDICVSPDGRYAYVTHILSNFNRPPSQVELGWTNMNVLTVLDVAEKRLVNTIGLDDMHLGAGNPWGVACTHDGQTVCVSHAGSEELTVLDAAALRGDLSRPYLSALVSGVSVHTGSQTGARRRVDLPGKSPRGIVIAGSYVYVAEYFSDTVSVVDLQAAGDARPRTIALGPSPQLDVRSRGEYLFQNAKICYQRWQSCASCHPDGRADALNWDLFNDGIGTSKNTKSLLLSHRTPPAMSEGVRATAEVAVRSGITHILFTERPEADALAMDEYLRSLQPVPSPYLVDRPSCSKNGASTGRSDRSQSHFRSEAAERGRLLFETNRIGCYRCHPAPLYTDLKRHNVGTRTNYEYVDHFDTPTLVEIWRTAPYLHDGRYTTIRELIVDGQHGLSPSVVETLREDEIVQLVEFVLSL